MANHTYGRAAYYHDSAVGVETFSLQHDLVGVHDMNCILATFKDIARVISHI